MIAGFVGYGFLLLVLVGIIRRFPVLWELALVAAIGGLYWLFFRTPPAGD